MKTLTDKQFCMVTLAIHLILIIAARLMIDSYQDGFLVLAGILLVVYFAFLLWEYRGRVISKEVVWLYVIGVMIQAVLTQGFGWIGDPCYGYLGTLGFGSAIAMLFYGVGLMASCVVLLMIYIVKLIIH